MECISNNPLSSMPPEIKEQILLKLPPQQILLSQFVCRDWRSVIADNRFWNRFKLEIKTDNLQEIKLLAFIYLIGKDAPRDETFGFTLAEKFVEGITRRELVKPSEKLLSYLVNVRRAHPDSRMKFEETWKRLPRFTILADLGHPFALYLRALAYMENETNSRLLSPNYLLTQYLMPKYSPIRSPKELAARKDLLKASERGFLSATYVLALKGTNYLDALIKINSPEAQFFAFRALFSSLNEVHISTSHFNRALEGLRKSAENGYHWAQYALALYKNDGESPKWALRAAMQGNRLAQFYVGQRINTLEKVACEREFQWLEKAKGLGEKMPYFYLSRLCYEKRGDLSKNELGLLKELTHEEATIPFQWTQTPYLFCLLYTYGNIVTRDKSKALGYYYQTRARDLSSAEFLKRVDRVIEE